VISSPGSETVLFETSTTSGWPDESRSRGYPLREIDGGSRILHTAYHQRRVQRPKGLEPVRKAAQGL
jgi:hypothetical protein